MQKPINRLAASLFLVAGCSPSQGTTNNPTPDLSMSATPSDMAMPYSTDMAFEHWPAGPAALSVRIPTSTIPPGKEINEFYNATLPSDSAIWVQKVGWTASPGLHHSQVNIGDNPLSFSLAVGQAEGEQEFPLGYAMPLAAKQQMLISYHFINASMTAQPADVEVKFYPVTEPPAVTPIPISMVPFLYQPIHIPPHTTKKVDVTCALPRDVEVHGMLSHIHHFGLHVEANVVGGAHDGLVIYSTDLWENAPIEQYHPPLKLAKGDSIHYSCEWKNTTDSEVVWGAESEQEMCGVAAWMSPVNNDLYAKVSVEGGPCEWGGL